MAVSSLDPGKPAPDTPSTDSSTAEVSLAPLVGHLQLDRGLEKKLETKRLQLVTATCFAPPKPHQAARVRTASVLHAPENRHLLGLLMPHFNSELSELPLILRCIEFVLKKFQELILTAPKLRRVKDATFEADWTGGITKLNIPNAICRAIGAELSFLCAIALGMPPFSAITWIAISDKDYDPEAYRNGFNRLAMWSMNCSSGLLEAFPREMQVVFRNFPEAVQKICNKDINLFWEAHPSSNPIKRQFKELSEVYQQLVFFFSNLSRFLPLELGGDFFKSLESPNSPLASSFNVISTSLVPPLNELTKAIATADERPLSIKNIYNQVVELKLLLSQHEFTLASHLLKGWAREQYGVLHPDEQNPTFASFDELRGFTAAFSLFYGFEVSLETALSLAHRICWGYFGKHLKNSSMPIRQRSNELLRVLIGNAEFYITHMREQLSSSDQFRTLEEQNWRNVYQSTCHKAQEHLALLQALVTGCHSLSLGEFLHQMNWMTLSISTKDRVSSSDQNGGRDQTPPSSKPTSLSAKDRVSSSDQNGGRDQTPPSSKPTSLDPPTSLYHIKQIFDVFCICRQLAITQLNLDFSAIIAQHLQLVTMASDEQISRKIARANALAQELIHQEKSTKPSLSIDPTTQAKRQQHSQDGPLGPLKDVPDLFDPHPEDQLSELDEKTDEMASSRLAASAAESTTKKKRRKKKPPISPLSALPPGTVDKVLSCLAADAPHLSPPLQNFALWADAIERMSAEMSIDRALTQIDFYRRMIEALFHFLLLQGNATIPNTHNLHELATCVTENQAIAIPVRQVVRDNHPLFSVLSHANEMTHYPNSHRSTHVNPTRFQNHVFKMVANPNECRQLITVMGQTITALVDTIANPHSYSPPRAPHPIKTSDLFSQEPFEPLQEDPLVSAEPEEDVSSPSSTDPLPPTFVRNSLSAVATIEALLRMIRLIQLKPVIGDGDHPDRRSLRDQALKNADLLLIRSLNQLHPSARCLIGGIETVEVVRKGLKELVIALLYHHGCPIDSVHRHTNSLQFVCSLASHHIPHFRLERPLPSHLGDFHRAFNYPCPYHYHESRHGRVTEVVRQALGRPDEPERVYNQWLFPLLQSFLGVISEKRII